MIDTFRRVSDDDLIGGVLIASKWRFYAGTVAEWILDYPRYDPSAVNHESFSQFRNGLAVVTNSNKHEYCYAMGPYELSLSDIDLLANSNVEYGCELSVIVDFDNNIYINGFSEIPMHQFVPMGWRGYEGDPLSYLPENLRLHFAS